MSSREFAEWLAFNNIEPIGQQRGDMQAAVIAQTVAACHTPKGGRVPELTDFMPLLKAKLEEERKESGWRGWMNSLKAAFGG